jgi:muramoyltetrapeptide carboxypeptidase
LIEDLDEYLYHIDRMIQSLKISGAFTKLRALVVGSMSDMHDNVIPFGQTAHEIILSAVQEYQIPVIFNAPIGHQSVNYAVKLGMDCIFDGQVFKQA